MDAFDVRVVARVQSDGLVPGGDSVQWTIFGKFSVFLMTADACFFSADFATEARCTAWMGGTTLSVNSTVRQPNSVIGGAAKRS